MEGDVNSVQHGNSHSCLVVTGKLDNPELLKRLKPPGPATDGREKPTVNCPLGSLALRARANSGGATQKLAGFWWAAWAASQPARLRFLSSSPPSRHFIISRSLYAPRQGLVLWCRWRGLCVCPCQPCGCQQTHDEREPYKTMSYKAKP